MSLVETVDVNCDYCGHDKHVVVAETKDWGYETCDNIFHYVRCLMCDQVYLKNRPTERELNTIYPNYYTTYSYNDFLGPFLTRVRGIVQKMKIAPIRKFAPPGATVVDVGCGNGELLRIIKQHGDPSWNLVGVDFSDDSMRCLKDLGIAGIKGRFEQLEWKGPRPHVIVLNQVIEHLAAPSTVIRRSFELLAPGGVMIIETPSLEAWDAALFRRRYWGGWHCPRHWNVFTPKTLCRSLESAGFSIDSVVFILHAYGWLHSMQYLFVGQFGFKAFGRKVFAENFLPSLIVVTIIDLIQKLVRGRTSNMRVVARKSQAVGASP